MMNFEQKLKCQFDTLKVTVLHEAKYQHHLYADYVELVCLLSNDYVSTSDIIDRLTDNGVNFPLENEKLDGEIGLIEPEIDDNKEGWINVIFDVVKERESLYGESYPFKINNNKIKLKDELDSIRKFYIFLLISSSLKFFGKLQSVLTTEFEVLSEKVLSKYLPENAIVKPFGNNSEFKGNAINKIKQLADLLFIDVEDYEINQISEHNSKEEGLDLVGWIPFSDSNSNSLIVLVQCGCGKDWNRKRFETSRYENFYRFYKQPPIHSLFIPYALSNNDGKFYQSKDIVKPTLVFERYRIIEYAKLIDFDDSFLSKQIVEKCIEYQEDIV